jgi:regulator of sigma E protease
MLAVSQFIAFSLPTLDGLEKIVVFLLMLSVLVLLHEGGHFLLARLNGVRVNDFAVGFGPTLLKWTSPRSGTNYRINLLPIGGYCAMQGEDGKTNEAEQQRLFREEHDQLASASSATSGSVAVLERPAATAAPSINPRPAVAAADNFQAKTTWQRLSIVVAGPIANFILAYVILLVAAVTFGVASTTFSTVIGPLQEGSPGAKAGLAIGDRIVTVNGASMTDGNALVKKIQASAGVPLTIGFMRHGDLQSVVVTPRAEKVDGKTIGRIGFLRIPQFQRVGIFQAFPIAWAEFADQTTAQVTGVFALFMHPVEHASSLSGVIGMERAASATQDLGWAPYLSLAAAISVALGILNLLPFPALDGGRAVFIIAEMLRGRPVDPEKEALVHVTGFAVLMVLMVFVAYHDIANIVSGKGVF